MATLETELAMETLSYSYDSMMWWDQKKVQDDHQTKCGFSPDGSASPKKTTPPKSHLSCAIPHPFKNANDSDSACTEWCLLLPQSTPPMELLKFQGTTRLP